MGPKSRRQIERGILPNRKKARWCAGPAKMLEPTIAMVEGEEVKTALAQLHDRSKPQINILEEVNLSKNPKEKRNVFISSDLPIEFKCELIHLLHRYQDVFAWTYQAMPGLDHTPVTHKLATSPNIKPVYVEVGSL